METKINKISPRKFQCKWCEEEMFKKYIEKHECPRIFIHKINNFDEGDKYIIRGKITLKWIGRSLLIEKILE